MYERMPVRVRLDTGQVCDAVLINPMMLEVELIAERAVGRFMDTMNDRVFRRMVCLGYERFELLRPENVRGRTSSCRIEVSATTGESINDLCFLR